MGFNYLAKLTCMVLRQLGFRLRKDLASVLSRISYLLFFAYFVDLFKSRFLPLYLPGLADDRRKNYVFNRSTSVILWFITVLIACEIVSTYLNIPLSSTIAFGGSATTVPLCKTSSVLSNNHSVPLYWA